MGGGTIREAGKEPGSPLGLGLIYQYGLVLVHTSSTPQDTLTAFPFLFSLAAALFSHTQQDSLLHSESTQRGLRRLLLPHPLSPFTLLYIASS